jgi:Tol biopolymer transport system component
MHPFSWRLTLRVVATLSWIVSILWLLIQPGFEPLLAFLGGTASFLLSFAASDAPISNPLKHGQSSAPYEGIKQEKVHEPYVFISYSHLDGDYAHRLAKALEQKGHSVWIDERIDFGTQWPRVIEEHVDACSAFIVIMTPRSKQSIWVQNELIRANRKGKAVFPLLLEGEQWLSVEATQYVDVTGGRLPPPDFYERLVQVAPRRKAIYESDEPKTHRTTAPATQKPVPLRRVVSAVPKPAQRSKVVWKNPKIIFGSIAALAVGTVAIIGLIRSQPPAPPTETTDIAQTARAEQTPMAEVSGSSLAPSHTPTASLTRTHSPEPTPFGGGTGRIAFASNRDGDSEIYVMNADGSNVINLTNNSADDSDPAWSPDGTRIAYMVRRGGHGQSELYVMNADGGNNTLLVPDCGDDAGGGCVMPAWSPDGTKIAFQMGTRAGQEVYVINADGSGMRRLTNNPGGDNYDPTWSPDGSRIAFGGRRGPWGIWIMNSNGSNQYSISGDMDGGPSWSPDGTRIVFDSPSGIYRGNTQIYVMNIDGSNMTRLTSNSANDTGPKWSPNGTRIAFSSDRDGNSEIYVMNADGSGQTNLTNNSATDSAPVWQP